MTANTHQLIAAISTNAYCEQKHRREVQRLLEKGLAEKDPLTYLKAAAKAQPVAPNRFDLEDLELRRPFALAGFTSPIERHTLSYDSMDESLEAFYFWLLDELANQGWTVTKLVDSFSATPGSGLSSEMNRRGVQAQQQAMKILREAQTLVRDILRSAAALKTGPELEEEAPGVEVAQAKADKDLLRWQVDTLKLYAHWLGPYLRQTRELQPRPDKGVNLVSVFNTTNMEVVLLAQREYPVKEDVDAGRLPKMFLKAGPRTYSSVLVVEVQMRSAPERTPGGSYGHRGRREIVLTSYALNADELAVLRGAMEQDELGEVIEAVAGRSRAVVEGVIARIESPGQKPPKPESEPEDSNPFAALFSFLRPLWKDRHEAEIMAPQPGGGPIRGDTDAEQVVRSLAILDARRRCLEFYEHCKQALMAS